ncbi:hypothetical protein B0J17DRAFT_237882 [Rhizoctonia solani]|nr:hypothetical protein B0J17DRAFT_237882 [Rhizoctonia solani]
MDDETIERLYSQIPGATLDRSLGGYIFPTNTRVPELAFCVGRWLFTIPSKDLAFSDADNDVFLKHVYVVFDQGKNPRLDRLIMDHHRQFAVSS